MLNILFCYAKEHPAVSYRQGMHELLAPILFVLYSEDRGDVTADDSIRYIQRVVYPNKVQVTYPNKVQVIYPNKVQVIYSNKVQVTYPNKVQVTYPNKVQVIYPNKVQVIYSNNR